MKRIAYIYWTVLVALGTVLLGSLLDPLRSVEESTLALSFDLPRLLSMLTSPFLLLCVGGMAWGIWRANKVWASTRPTAFTDTDRMVIIWYLMNAAWFHTGCDVCSGLFQVMPNLTDAYAISNAVHLNPRYHEARAFLDAIYWFELLVEMPLCVLVFKLSLKRSVWAHPVEILLCGFHFAGTVAFYVPNLLMGEVSNPVLSNVDRVVGSIWIIVPTILAVRAMKLLAGRIETGAPLFGTVDAEAA